MRIRSLCILAEMQNYYYRKKRRKVQQLDCFNITYPSSSSSPCGGEYILLEKLRSSSISSSSSPKLARDMVSIEMVSARSSGLVSRGLATGGAYRKAGPDVRVMQARSQLVNSKVTHWEDVIVFGCVHQTRGFLNSGYHLKKCSRSNDK